MAVVLRLSEPAMITALQIGSHTCAAVAGGLIVGGAFPYLLHGLPTLLAVVLGSVLLVGGVGGAAACMRGIWWVERIALLLVGLGWVLLVPSVLFIELPGFVRGMLLVLLAVGVFDVGKRYRRIDWAYLDPAK